MTRTARYWFALAMVCLLGGFVARAAAAELRVLQPGSLPNDKRLGKLKDFDGYFPFTPSLTRDAWAKRAARVRRQILVATGLWPLPSRTPANPVIHGKIDRGEYSVEKVYFESFPGHFVTGNLYRPMGKPGRHPGVLCPHGHWPEGRFNDTGPQKIREQIAEGAERFELGGRHPLQARCVQLARMGCVVFHYDMIGYADSVQIPLEVAHRIIKQRPQLDTPENWGFFSTQAELWQQSIMGVQTYNGLRALDWLSSLEDVDPTRIGCTGASGGGTQTFILSAIDPRVTAAFPAVMVSTGMQGGCTCENCCHLRVNTGNIEFSAMTAPRALGMSGADDWTKELMTKGYPELKQHFGMMEAGDRVMAKVMTQFPHNYNFVSRELMYQWFNKHLKLGLPEPVLEQDYNPLSVSEMSVWDEQHPKPQGGEDYERKLLRLITDDSRKQVAALEPTDERSLARFRDVVGGAVDVLIGRSLPNARNVEEARMSEQDYGDYRQWRLVVRNVPEGEELPAVMLLPRESKGTTVVWLHPGGKSSLLDKSGKPVAAARKLLDAGSMILAADLLYQGEFLPESKPLATARKVDNPRECLGFTLGYNPSLFAQRAHDVLTLIAFAKNMSGNPGRVSLLAWPGAGHWAVAALAQAPGSVDQAAIDTAGFRFASVRSIYDPDMLPGVVKYGDLPALLALAAPTKLFLTGEGPQPPGVVAKAYKAAGKADEVSTSTADRQKSGQAAVEWLTK